MIIIKDLCIFTELEQKILLCVPQYVFSGNELVWFIQGPSGIGKTIFLQTISRNFLSYSGNIIIDSVAIEYYDREYFAEKLQYLDQSYVLFEHMAIGEQLVYSLKKIKKIDHDVAVTMVCEHLMKVGLSEHKGKFPFQLSGGQRQRAALVQKIILDPEYLLLDEPTSALDYVSKIFVFEYLLQYQNKQKKILISTHDADLISFFKKKIIVNIQDISKY